MRAGGEREEGGTDPHLLVASYGPHHTIIIIIIIRIVIDRPPSARDPLRSMLIERPSMHHPCACAPISRECACPG